MAEFIRPEHLREVNFRILRKDLPPPPYPTTAPIPIWNGGQIMCALKYETGARAGTACNHPEGFNCWDCEVLDRVGDSIAMRMDAEERRVEAEKSKGVIFTQPK